MKALLCVFLFCGIIAIPACARLESRFKEGITRNTLFYLHPDQHGWERFGQDHRETTKPFIEGAWMTKYNGRYYLQYAAPGTEYNAM